MFRQHCPAHVAPLTAATRLCPLNRCRGFSGFYFPTGEERELWEKSGPEDTPHPPFLDESGRQGSGWPVPPVGPPGRALLALAVPRLPLQPAPWPFSS